MKKKDNMRQNTRSSDDETIRYLMREMDPSEEVEFEREMMKDENLLIEVESLRSTYKKLGKLPFKEPPKHISDQVIKEAVEIQQKEIKRNNRLVNWLGRSVAVAATIILAISAGYHFFDEAFDVSPNLQNHVVNSANAVQPWVNRNEVLRISENQNAIRSGQLDEAYTESFNKLILVEDKAILVNSGQQILLTNSPSN